MRVWARVLLILLEKWNTFYFNQQLQKFWILHVRRSYLVYLMMLFFYNHCIKPALSWRSSCDCERINQGWNLLKLEWSQSHPAKANETYCIFSNFLFLDYVFDATVQIFNFHSVAGYILLMRIPFSLLHYKRVLVWILHHPLIMVVKAVIAVRLFHLFHCSTTF